MAIGQLLDYSRFVRPTPRMAVLLPSEPRRDLRELLASAGIEMVWRDSETFREPDEGLV
jgi:hypothetical protein